MADVFQIESDVLPSSARVLAFTGEEALSTLFRFDVHVLIHEAESPNLDIEGLVSHAVTLRVLFDDLSPRMTFHGVIASVELIHEAEGEGLYCVTVMPKLWHLSLNRHSRVFADKSVYKSVKEVIKKVMTLNRFAEGEDYEFRLSKTYKPYEHITQYKESDFDFISRWMEREGIYYFFEHDGAKEKMVLIDDFAQHVSLAHDAKRYFPHGGHETSAIEAFQSFTARVNTLPARVTLRDYDYLRPTVPVTSTREVSARVDEEVMRFGENYDAAHVGDLSTVRSQEFIAQGTEYRGGGRVYDLRPGYRFELTEHTRADMNRAYLTTALRHEATNLSAGHESALRALGVHFETPYRVEVTAIKHDTQYRAPCVTPVPRIWGVEGATVDGPGTSPYAQIDGHGRYKVRVRFDELLHTDDKNSLFIRMLQPHGGTPEGFHFPLRKGTEVMLVFVGGDPDVPLIASVAPNADRPSPVTSHNHTLNVIHTGSDNRLEIDDAQNAQYIDWSTPHQSTSFHMGAKTNYRFNVFLTTRGDCGFDFGTNWDIKVGGWKHEDVTLEVVETYHDVHKTEVLQLVTEHYHQGQKTTIDAVGQKTEVTGLVEEIYHTGQKTTITSGQKTDVTGLVEETYHTGQKTTITDGQVHTVTGAATHTYNTGLTVNVTGDKTETINSTYTLTVNGNKVESVTGEESYVKGAERAMILGIQSEIYMGLKHETHIGANFDLHLSLECAVHIGPKIELRSGMDITAHAGFSLTLKEAVEVDTEGMTLKNAAARIQTTGAFTGVSSIHMFV